MKITVIRDIEPMNPREEFEHLGEMHCAHPRYQLGDLQLPTGVGFCFDIADGVPYVSLPLYLYDHSGLAMKTTPFSCGWDSGQVGWIIALAPRIAEWLGKLEAELVDGYGQILPDIADKVCNILRAEVAEYNAYLSGEVWGYLIERPTCECGHATELVDSCFGFFGDDALDDMLHQVADEHHDAMRQAWEARE